MASPLLAIAGKITANLASATAFKNTNLDHVHAGSLLGKVIGGGVHGGTGGILSSIGHGIADAYGLNSMAGGKSSTSNSSPNNKSTSKNQLPVLDVQISTARKVDAPTITTLVQQTKSILKKFELLSQSLKVQVDGSVKQAVNQENAIKQAKMEKVANLSPNIKTEDPLVEAINSLNNKIQEIAGESHESSSMLGGLLGMFKGGKIASLLKRGSKLLSSLGGDAVKVGKGFTKEVTAAGRTVFRDAATGRFVKAADAIAKPGVFGKAAGSFKGLLGKAAGSGVAAKIGERLGVKALKDITPDIIKKLAIPLAEKAVGKTVLKSIPLVGAAVGIGFALNRLVHGDVVGAGLDAVSGLAGPMTAIPALVLSLARDIYSDVFNIEPESDPLVGTRMGMVKDGVEKAVMDVMRPAVKVAKVAPAANQKALQLPTIKPPANDNAVKRPNVMNLPSKPPNMGSSSKPPAPKIATQHTSSVGGGKGSSASVAPSAAKMSPVSMGSQSAPTVSKGLSLSSASNQSAALSSGTLPVADASTTTPVPSNLPTSKSNSIGIGNVPDPSFPDMGEFADQFYFSAAA